MIHIYAVVQVPHSPHTSISNVRIPRVHQSTVLECPQPLITSGAMYSKKYHHVSLLLLGKMYKIYLQCQQSCLFSDCSHNFWYQWQVANKSNHVVSIA